jgi:hypothetical protein
MLESVASFRTVQLSEVVGVVEVEQAGNRPNNDRDSQRDRADESQLRPPMKEEIAHLASVPPIAEDPLSRSDSGQRG